MGRTVALFVLLMSVGVAVGPILAQDQRGQGRGQGFRGGRGAGQGPGMGRGMRNHGPSDKADAPHALTFPSIADHGGVVQLPDAAQQPRAGTKLLVDLTSGGDEDKLNAGLEKVAKYMNIYAGGGAKPAEVKIAVVLHGGATLAVLNDEAYAKRFEVESNPNLQIMQSLHQSGVELFVCGQSLISKGSDPKEVAPFVKTAVSALTAVVNLQADGYAYVPLASSAPAPTAESQASTSDEELLASQENQEAESIPEHGMGLGRGRGMGMGRGMGPGMGRGPNAMQGMQGDMSTLHAMFADREMIKRTVKNLPDGAEAVTESDDEAIANLLKEHVPAMEDRVLGNDPLPPMTFHPIFVELIKHAEDYTLTYEETDKGMKVTYQSDDPFVIMLVQEHAKLVSRFIKNGMEEIHKPYTLPKIPEGNKPRGR